MAAATLKFKDPEVEVAFKTKVNNDIRRSTCLASPFLAAILFASFLMLYNTETSREDDPFAWSVKDSRTLFLLAHLVDTGIFAVVGCLTVAGTFSGRLASLNWEVLVVLTIGVFVWSLVLMSAWHVAKLFGREPEEVWAHEVRDCEFMTLLEIVAALTGTCLYLPIRAYILWLVHACALSTYLVMIILGSPFPDATSRVFVYLVAFCFFSYHGARYREWQDRRQWYSERQLNNETGELKDVKSAYQQVASAFCEIVVKLGACGHVEDSDRMVNAYFGRIMEGHAFEEVLAPGDRERFAGLLRQASTSQHLQSMPATLDLHFSTAKAQLIIVDTNAASLRNRNPSWLVGVHSAEAAQPQAVEMHSDMIDSIARGLGQHPHEFDQDTRMESLPTTTETGRVFASVGAEDVEGGVRRRLERIVEMGRREHWLIHPEEMDLLPKQLLGMGGFGIVIAGRLRGTPVAVKLPKRGKGFGRSVASISNELRLHRHVRHPNIVLCYGACIRPESGHLALVCELVNGIQLGVYVVEMGSSPELKVRHKLLLDMACALRFLHTHSPKIVHGDLKPSNVLVEPGVSGPHVKILDFGLSQLRTKCAEPDGGTLEWMAPERLLEGGRRQKVAPSADIFSFGRLAYFVCTGLNLLSVYQESLLMHMVRQGRPVPLRWVAGTPFLEECRELCDMCLGPTPESRPGATEVMAKLVGWLPMSECLEASRVAVVSDAAEWCSGVRQVEEAMDIDASSNNVGTARARENLYLDELEALVERSDSSDADESREGSEGIHALAPMSL